MKFIEKIEIELGLEKNEAIVMNSFLNSVPNKKKLEEYFNKQVLPVFKVIREHPQGVYLINRYFALLHKYSSQPDIKSSQKVIRLVEKMKAYGTKILELQSHEESILTEVGWDCINAITKHKIISDQASKFLKKNISGHKDIVKISDFKPVANVIKQALEERKIQIEIKEFNKGSFLRLSTGIVSPAKLIVNGLWLLGYHISEETVIKQLK